MNDIMKDVKATTSVFTPLGASKVFMAMVFTIYKIVEPKNFGILFDIAVPLSLFCGFIWIGVYFHSISTDMDKALKLYPNKLEPNEYKSLKNLRDTIVTKGFSYTINGACLIYSILISGVYPIVAMFSYGIKWWSLIICIIEILLLQSVAFLTSLFAIDTVKNRKSIDKKLKEYEESIWEN